MVFLVESLCRAREWSANYEDAAFDGALRQHCLEILAHDFCHGELVLQDLSVSTKRVELFV